jgi:hypothetical protein
MTMANQKKRLTLRKWADELPSREEIREQIAGNKKTLLALGLVFTVGLAVGALLSRKGDE